MQLGANCNARLQASFWCPVENSWLRWYYENGEAVLDCSINANTSLCMCVFRMSDCFLQESQQQQLVEVAALKLFEQRYGRPRMFADTQNTTSFDEDDKDDNGNHDDYDEDQGEPYNKLYAVLTLAHDNLS